jgi:beta-phosphoglucomutase-like phosphatase (HAD superfamily)
MSEHGQNGGEPRARLDPKTADYNNPEQVREIAVHVDESLKALLESHAHLASASKASHDRTEATLQAFGPKIEALVREQGREATEVGNIATAVHAMAENVAALAKSVISYQRSNDATLFILDAKGEERGRITQQEIERLQRQLVDTRATVNALSSTRPDVDELEAVSKVHDINAIVAAQFERRELETHRRHMSFISKEQRRTRDQVWDITKIVIAVSFTAAVTILLAYLGFKK